MTQRDVRQGYGAQLFSASLHGANGGHWNFAAGTPGALRANLYPPPPATPPGAPPSPRVEPLSETPIRLAAQAAVTYLMPSYEQGGGIDSGHVVIAWQQDGTAYQISVHGINNAGRVRLMAEGWILKIRAARAT